VRVLEASCSCSGLDLLFGQCGSVYGRYGNRIVGGDRQDSFGAVVNVVITKVREPNAEVSGHVGRT
jgi:hypothetical protein